jgi:RecA-family ATPase
MSVRANQRHKRKNPCPICQGGDDDPRGKEKRCHGFTSDDGYAHCSREELAGDIEADPTGDTYAHRLSGPCRCGTTHGEAQSGTTSRSDNIEATYDYVDESGTLLFQVVRFAGKKFRQRRPNGPGWIWQLDSVRRVPFRLPRLLANPEAAVYVAEGEKDVLALERVGLVATCNPQGAGKWSSCAETARKVLAGRDIVVVADNDEPGRKHALDVLADLQPVAKSARILVAPEPHKDVSDLLSTGGSIAQLVPLEKPPVAVVDDLAPELPFDEIWSAEPEANLVVPAMGIAPGPAHLVAGSWYTGKTLVLMTMGMSVASGRSIFGVWRTRVGKWIHFDHEMGRRHIKRYLQRLRSGLDIDPEVLRGMMSLRVLPRLNLRSPNAIDEYSRLLEGYSIATIDPLRAAAPGADENDSEFRQYIDIMGIVSDRTGCAVMLLHHGGKPTEGSQRRNTGRGTSAIDDAVQSKFVLTAEEKGAPIMVSHEKTRELNQPLDDFYLRIDSSEESVKLVHMLPDELAATTEKARADRDAAKLAKAKDSVRAALAKYAGRVTGSRDDLIKLSGGDRTMVQKAISEMLATGVLVRDGRGAGGGFGLRSESV